MEGHLCLRVKKFVAPSASASLRHALSLLQLFLPSCLCQGSNGVTGGEGISGETCIDSVSGGQSVSPFLLSSRVFLCKLCCWFGLWGDLKPKIVGSGMLLMVLDAVLKSFGDILTPNKLEKVIFLKLQA